MSPARSALKSSEALRLTVMKPFQRFFGKFVSGSFLLFGATLVAMIWANLAPEGYQHFWHTDLTLTFGHADFGRSAAHWIDEALMTLFFFTVGLEIKREILVGELANFRKAMLPVAAAAGGMLIPAAIYLSFNHGTSAAHGWGIPMATDIAFSLAVLAAVGARAPLGLRVFLSAFAIADDLGAVVVIALFYTRQLAWHYLGLALVFLIALALANRLWIRRTSVYALLGLGLWACVLLSGVHATVAGVLVAMFIPARGRYDTDTFLRKANAALEQFTCAGDSCGFSIMLNKDHQDAVKQIEVACQDVETPLQRLEHGLHTFVSHWVLPLFALANAGLVLRGVDLSGALFHPVTLGVGLGLSLGKPLGITLFTWMGVRFFKAALPDGVGWRQIFGAGILGGIGFTMSLFISGLSFTSPELLESAKLGIIASSILAGTVGLAFLALGGRGRRPSSSAAGDG
jgi:NhaA family Na+:H+ antiporter